MQLRAVMLPEFVNNLDERAGERGRPLASKSIPFIISVALIIRLLFFGALEPWNEQVLHEKVLLGDAFGYHAMAIQIVSSKSFDSGQMYRTPGYPFFISIFYAIAGPKPWLVMLAQLFLSTGSAMLVYKLSRIFFNGTLSAIAAAAFAFDPHTILFSTKLLSETLFTFIFLLSILTFLLALRGDRLILFGLGGLLLGFATLVRPVSAYFPFVLVPLLLQAPRMAFISKMKAICCAMIVFTMTITPWMYRNFEKFQHFSLTNAQGIYLYLDIAASVEAAQTGKPVEQVRDEFRMVAAQHGANDTDNPFHMSDVYRQLGLRYIRTNFSEFARYYAKGIVNIFTSVGTGDFFDMLRISQAGLRQSDSAEEIHPSWLMRYLSHRTRAEFAFAACIALYLSIVYLFFVFGSIRMILERNFFLLSWITLILGYLCVATGTMGYARFKLPMIPFYSIMSGKGVYDFFQLLKARRASIHNR